MRTSRPGCVVSLLFAVLLFIVALPVNAFAQTAHFSYSQLILGGGFTRPVSVAVDSSGNVFVADAGNSAVKEIPSGCVTSSCVVVLGSGFNTPNGVAVDATGNVIVGDTQNNAVKAILAVNGSIPASPTIATLGGGFKEPAGVAKDALGNVFVSDFGNSAVKRIPAGCVSAGCVVTLTTISYPNGIAVDASGNVFVTSAISNAVYEILAVGGSIPVSPTVNTLGSGFSYPNGVAVDKAGNVLVTDSGNNALKEILAVNGSIPTSPTIVTLDSGLYWPTDVVLDAQGALYVADYKNDRVVQLEIEAMNFGSGAIGQASAPTSLIFTFDSGGTIGSPVALTMGTPGLDFAVVVLSGGGQCAAGSSYSAGDTCTVNVTFTPAVSGTRTGAILLQDSSGNTIATEYLRGIGTGPQIVYMPTRESTLVSGFAIPFGVVVDGRGNLYVADTNNNAVKSIPLGCTASTCVTTLPGSFSSPQALAIDAAGNLFVADSGNNAIKEIPHGCTTAACVITLSSSFNSPAGVGVDNNGNVYVGDMYNNAVKEILAVNGSIPASPTIVTLGFGFEFYHPEGVAVDYSGNIFISDTGNSQVEEIPVGCTSKSCIAPVINGFQYPDGIAIDGSANLYIADGAGTVRETYAGCATASCVQSLGYGYKNPEGVAVDGAYNVYVADSGNNRIVKLDYSDPPSLTFVTPTPAGSTDTTDGTLEVTIQNYGSAALTLSGIAISNANFKIDSSTTTCSTSSPVVVGGGCVVGVLFTPTAAGALTGTLTLTDNALNVSSATQQIALSGTGQSTGTTTSVTVGTTPAGLSFSVDGTTYTSTQSLTWNIGDSHTIATTSPQTSGGTQNTFASWSDGGAMSHSVTASASTTSYTATFSTAYQLTTAASPTAGGTVTPAAGSYYASGTVVNLSAVPNSGYTFSSWTGNVANSASATTTVTMSAAQSVTANFSTSSPAVTLTPTVLSFGSQTDGTTSTAQNVVLKNSGSAPLTITAVAATGANAANFLESDNCVSSSPLAANATCTIAVQFAPTSPGSDTASVSITDNATGSPQGVTLSGTGTAPLAPIASLTPASLSFSAISGTSSASQTATLSNTGNAALTIGGITIGGANPGDFSETNNCGTSLAAGTSCSISVTFSPASVANFTATLAVADNAAGTPQTATLSGTGTAPDYSVNSSTPSQTVTTGGAATYNVNVQSIGSYNGSVTLSVTGLPTGATATFSPNPVTLGATSTDVPRRAAASNTSGTSILTVQTNSGARLAELRASWPFIAPVFGFLMMLPARRLRRQLILRFLVIFMIFGTAFAMVGCGGGFAIAPQAKTYTLTITGTNGAVTHSTTVLLTVK